MIKITVYDSATPMLDKIALISRKAALAVLDQAGMELRNKTREAFESARAHTWHTKIVDGKRKFYQNNVPAVFGKRLNYHKNGPDNMSSLITSYVMDKHLTVVVAGMHKAFKPRYFYQEYKNPDSDAPIYAGEHVEATLGGSWEILNKLDRGGRFSSQSEKYKRTRLKPDQKPVGKNPSYYPRRWAELGRQASLSKINDTMTRRLEELIGRQVNRTEVKTKVIA